MTELLQVATSIAAGVFAGFIYGIVRYSRVRQTNGERFNPAKLTGTLIVSGFVGAAFGFFGIAVTEANIIPILAAHAGVIVLFEDVSKMAFEKLGWFPEYYE